MVLLDLALKIEPSLNVFVADTELLFPRRMRSWNASSGRTASR